MPIPSTRRAPSALIVALLAAATVASAADAHAGIPWHGTLEQARAASQISRKPVLVVFGASWSQASVALHEQTLANPEAVAIVTACFEPVKIDVDSDPLTTKRLGVTYLPSACVVGSDDQVLASFDCPDTPASFVAAVGRAAQEAATSLREQQPRSTTPPAQATDPIEPTPAASGTGLSPSIAPKTDTLSPSRGEAAAGTAALRPLSRFSSSRSESREAGGTPWPAEPATSAITPEPSPAPWNSTAAASAGFPESPFSKRAVIDPAATTQPGGSATTAAWLGDAAKAAQPPQTAAPVPSQETQAIGIPGSVTYGTTTLPQPAATAATAAPTTPPGKPDAEKPAAQSSFFAMLSKPFGFFSKPAKVEKAPPTTPPPVPVAGTTDAHGTMPLGMEGYCPVTLAEKGQWVEGRAQWGARHRGRTYLFAGEPQQRAFLVDPDRYAPALSGDDPVVAFDAGKSVPGQRRYGVTYQSRIYLFSSPETRTTFSGNPERYTARVTVAENPLPPSGTIRR